MLVLAFSAALVSSAAAQGKFGLDNPAVPVAPANAPQPAGAVLNSTGIPDATDAAPEDSPVSQRGGKLAGQRTSGGLKVGTAISMRLLQSVSSGTFKNGDSIHGTLSAALKTAGGTTLPAGTRVTGTVVSAAKAGSLESGGVLSLQLTRVGTVAVVTDVVDFNGQQGHKDVADSAPHKGHEAVARAGAVLQFHVLQNGVVPGVIPGARLDNTVGGGKGGQPASGQPATGQPASGQPDLGPGVNQVPVHGGSRTGVPQL